MKQIKLNQKKYNIPQSWDEVTLAMQIKVSADTEKIEIEELKQFAILSGYAGIPIEILKTAKLQDLQELFAAMAFIANPIEDKPIIEFDFQGKHYYCGQNIVESEFQDFISIENALQNASGHTYTALPTILAIMCKQKRADGQLESIDDYDINKRAIEFNHLPIPIAHNLQLFFSLNETLYSTIIPLSLNPTAQKVVVEKQIKEAENTLKELDGKGWLTHLQIGILRIYLKYIKRLLRKHFTSTQ